LGGAGQIGRLMQEDLEDAVEWAKSKGLVSRDRVCIYGASYGGYAALRGIQKTPDLYRCAVDKMGPSLVRDIIDSPFTDYASKPGSAEFLKWVYGDPDKDAARLDEVSPALHAELIKTPLLMIYGADDRRVPVVHGRRMRDAMQHAGKPFDWLIFPDEGHGFGTLEHRVAAYERTLSFFATHLKDDTQTAEAAVR
jgi:dipeptidyl aminopeptidase/acylaminoacyl peptidase